jgi:hypothetical protein
MEIVEVIALVSPAVEDDQVALMEDKRSVFSRRGRVPFEFLPFPIEGLQVETP